VDRKAAGSVLRDALDRANREFRRSTAEFQAAIQPATNGASQADHDLRVRQASRSHAEVGDALLVALARFEEFVFGGVIPPDLAFAADPTEAALESPALQSQS
jgi:hypothetical protein